MASPETRLRELGEAAIEGVERQQWLEPLAERLQRAVAAVFEAGGQTGRRVRDVLHGTWLGHPLHPVHTDIPLGAWTVAGILDLSGGNRRRERAADAAISIGPVQSALPSRELPTGTTRPPKIAVSDFSTAC